jgi:antitoxin HicB
MKIDKALIRSYPFTIRPLSPAEGGGFVIEYPDLPGCISDGETPEQAFENGADAVKAYLLDCAKHGDPLPTPTSASGQWRQRVPRSLHARLVHKARQEGVSLNTRHFHDCRGIGPAAAFVGPGSRRFTRWGRFQPAANRRVRRRLQKDPDQL